MSSLSCTKASSDKAAIANDLGITGGNITLMGWFNPQAQPATNTNHGYASQGDAGTFVKYGIMYQDAAGTKQLRVARRREGVAEGDIIDNVTLSDGTWYHLALTYDGTNLRGYKDGVEMTNSPLATSGDGSASANDHAEICRVFDGAADAAFGTVLAKDVYIFNAALSAANIIKFMLKAPSDNETNLSGKYLCDENTGTTIKNHAGATDLAMTGSTVAFASNNQPYSMK